jgi:hypothetical protein
MSVPVPERNESQAQFLDTAKEIFKMAAALHRKPYYADVRDTLVMDIYRLASDMLDCLVRANDIYLPRAQDEMTLKLIAIPEQQERVQLFVKAKGYLSALNVKLTELYMVKPVKHRYRGQKKKFGILMNQEYKLIKGVIDKEQAKLKKMTM